MVKKTVLIFTSLLVLLFGPGSFGQRPPSIQPGQLDNGTAPRDLRRTEAPSPAISERQAIALAREQFTGNVLRISLIGEGPALRYQIRMEDEGRIFTVFVNATSGSVSGG